MVSGLISPPPAKSEPSSEELRVSVTSIPAGHGIREGTFGVGVPTPASKASKDLVATADGTFTRAALVSFVEPVLVERLPVP